MALLDGRVALVTGAAGGIGSATARALAEAGARVLATDVDEARVLQVAEGLSADGREVVGRHLDVTHPPEVEAVVYEAVERFGQLDILVNIAGVLDMTPLDQLTPEVWDRVLGVNLKGTLLPCLAAMKVMKPRRQGRIISLGSMAGQVGGVVAGANYAAAKAGLFGFSKSLAREVGSRNITVNCIAPGFIATDMTRSLTEKQQQYLMQQIPLGRLGQPEDVASAVAFIASPAAGYITGATLHVNGGMFMD